MMSSRNSSENTAIQKNKISWNGPNFAVFCILGLSFLAAKIDDATIFFGSIDGERLKIAAFGAIGSLTHLTIKQFAKNIADFSPTETLGAKIANEQIKFLANSINGLIAGVVLAITITEMRNEIPQFEYLSVIYALAYWNHMGARNLIGLLKEEKSN